MASRHVLWKSVFGGGAWLGIGTSWGVVTKKKKEKKDIQFEQHETAEKDPVSIHLKAFRFTSQE